jgi:hypothetical protein
MLLGKTWNEFVLMHTYVKYFYALGTVQFEHRMVHGEHPVKIPVLPMCKPACLRRSTPFPNHWLGRSGPFARPPRSPDITALDFFLWGYLTGKVCATELTGVEHLKTRIGDVIITINRGMLARTWEELEFRLDIFCATSPQTGHVVSG